MEIIKFQTVFKVIRGKKIKITKVCLSIISSVKFRLKTILKAIFYVCFEYYIFYITYKINGKFLTNYTFICKIEKF